MQSYCLKERKQTESMLEQIITTKNGHHMVKSICVSCGAKKAAFIKKGGNIDIHKLIGKLPKPKRGWTLPGHRYTGPYNPLEQQLDENDNPIEGQEPYNDVDATAMVHDICYRDNDNKEGKKTCDKQMLTSLSNIKPKNMRERFDKTLISTVIGAKHKLGMGTSTKNTKAR